MTAEVLRRAATLMRERADTFTAAMNAPSASVGNGYDVPDTAEAFAVYRHWGSWHPAVAVAVANWLDDEAHLVDTGATPYVRALAVARAYLGEDAS